MKVNHRYAAFYNGRRIEVEAETIYQAQVKAAEALKVRGWKRMSIAVVLLGDDGKTVTVNNSN